MEGGQEVELEEPALGSGIEVGSFCAGAESGTVWRALVGFGIVWQLLEGGRVARNWLISKVGWRRRWRAGLGDEGMF